MRIAFVDDDYIYKVDFEQELEKLEPEQSFDYYADPAEFLTKSEEYDVVFLDIKFKLPDGREEDGLDTAENLRKTNPDILIVFISNYTDLVFNAFGLNVIGFIDKAYIHRDLPPIWTKLTREIATYRMISVYRMDNSSIQVIPLRSILYAHFDLRGVWLTFKEKDGTINTISIKERTLQNLYDDINLPSVFVYANRTTFINAKYIRHYDDTELVLEGIKRPIHISRRNFKQINLAYNRHAW